MQIACSPSIPAVLAFLGCTCVYGKSGFSPLDMTSTSLPDTLLGWITPSLIISVAGTYLQSITFALTPWPLTPPPPTFSTSNSRPLDVSSALNGPRHANIRKASVLSLCPAFHIHLFVQSPPSITTSAWCLLVLMIRFSAFLLQPALLLSLRPSSLQLSRNYLANSALHLRTIPLIVFTGAVPLLHSRQEPRNICSNSTATGALMLTSNT